MISFKPGAKGARIAGVQPELALGLMVAERVYERYGLDLTVTAVTDSAHSPGSLHYVGYAADLALPAEGEAQVVAADLQRALADEWDVVVEKDHLHLEFQPKRGLNL